MEDGNRENPQHEAKIDAKFKFSKNILHETCQTNLFASRRR